MATETVLVEVHEIVYHETTTTRTNVDTVTVEVSRKLISRDETVIGDNHVSREPVLTSPPGAIRVIEDLDHVDQDGNPHMEFTNGGESPIGLEDYRFGGYDFLEDSNSRSLTVFRFWINTVAANAAGLEQIGMRMLDHAKYRYLKRFSYQFTFRFPKMFAPGFRNCVIWQAKGSDSQGYDQTLGVNIERIGDHLELWVLRFRETGTARIVKPIGSIPIKAGEWHKIGIDYLSHVSHGHFRLRLDDELIVDLEGIQTVYTAPENNGNLGVGPCLYSYDIKADGDDPTAYMDVGRVLSHELPA